jgi:hypothetical protein
LNIHYDKAFEDAYNDAKNKDKGKVIRLHKFQCGKATLEEMLPYIREKAPCVQLNIFKNDKLLVCTTVVHAWEIKEVEYDRLHFTGQCGEFYISKHNLKEFVLFDIRDNDTGLIFIHKEG